MDINIGPLLLNEVVYDGGSNGATFGARPMRRAVQRYFEDTVSDAIIRGFVKDFDSVTVELDDSTGYSRKKKNTVKPNFLWFHIYIGYLR